MSANIFMELESQVRVYCRDYPVVFNKAKNATLTDIDGRKYIDFLSGAGALNYGHNDPDMSQAIISYMCSDRIVHSLDMYTEAKAEFLEAFREIVLSSCDTNYRVQFTGPTGTNAVKAAMKLARKVTGRSRIAAFTHGFHGMTLGALSAIGNRSKRLGAATALNGVDHFPYDGYMGSDINTLDLIETFLSDPSSGYEKPAAFIVETVQGEGGCRAARGLFRLRAK